MRSRPRSNFDENCSLSTVSFLILIVRTITSFWSSAKFPLYWFLHVVDLQNEIQLFVQRQIAHQFVLTILDFRIGCGQLRPLLRIDAHDPQFVGRLVRFRNELVHGWILRVKAVPVIAGPLDILGFTERRQRS